MTEYKLKKGSLTCDERLVDACVAAFDLLRDGCGNFRGTTQREIATQKQLFLRTTSDIVGRFVREDPKDPALRDRVLRVVRSVLAKRQGNDA